MERWADMPGFEAYYEISDHGNARSKERRYTNKDGRIITKHSKNLKPLIGSNGYIRFGLKLPDDPKVYKVLAHRKVAEAFILNPNNLDEVGHQDDIRGNNVYTNLYWTTHKDNIIKGVKSGRITSDAVRKANSLKTFLIDRDGNVKQFNSQGEASAYLGCTQGAVSMALKHGHLCCGYKVLAMRNITEVDISSDTEDNSAVTSKPVVITNGEMYIYCNSLNSAARKLGRNISSVIQDLQNHRKCNGFYIYIDL